MKAGRQVLLYLVDGTSRGLRTAEIANWTGHVVAAPRADLSRLIAREESRRTGVYILLGEDPAAAQSGSARVYVGESDEVATRLREHQGKKDWWDRVVVVTSQGQAQQLTKSQVRFLESQLIARAIASSRASVENATQPQFARLSEAETSNMEYFLDQLHVLMPAIGVDVFRPLEAVEGERVAEATDVSPTFFLEGKKRGLRASARMIEDEFVVLAGSTAVAAFSASSTYRESTARAYANYAATHADLVAKGALVIDGDSAVFARNVPFSSPSTAGAIVLGRSCNGRTSWLTEAGTQFGAWEGRGMNDGAG